MTALRAMHSGYGPAIFGNGPDDDAPPDPSVCPAWLVDELHANPVFVEEAICNNTGEIAREWAQIKANYDFAFHIGNAVDAWVAHWWKVGKQDADSISAKWKQWAKEAA